MIISSKVIKGDGTLMHNHDTIVKKI